MAKYKKYSYTSDQKINGVAITDITFDGTTGGAHNVGTYPDEISFTCILKHISINVSNGKVEEVQLLSDDETTSISLPTTSFSEFTKVTDYYETEVTFVFSGMRQLLFNYLNSKAKITDFSVSDNRKAYLKTLKALPNFTKIRLKFSLHNNYWNYTVDGSYTMNLATAYYNENKETWLPDGITKTIKFPTTNDTITPNDPSIKSATTNKQVYYRKNGTNYNNSNCLVGKLLTNEKTIEWSSQPKIILNSKTDYTDLRTPTKDRLVPIDRIILRLKISNGYFDTEVSLDDLANSDTITFLKNQSYSKDDGSTNPISTQTLGTEFIDTKFSIQLKDINDMVSNFSGDTVSNPFICSNPEVRIATLPTKNILLYRITNSHNNPTSNLTFTWDNSSTTNNFVSYYYKIYFYDDNKETLLFSRVGSVGTSTIPDDNETYPIIKPNGTNGFTITITPNDMSKKIEGHFVSLNQLTEGYFKIVKSLDSDFEIYSEKTGNTNHGLTLNNVTTKLYSRPMLSVKKKELFYDSAKQKCSIREREYTYGFSDQIDGKRRDVYINSTDSYNIKQLVFQTLENVEYTKMSVTIKDKYWSNNNITECSSFFTNLNSVLKTINNIPLGDSFRLIAIGNNPENCDNIYQLNIKYGDKTNSYHNPTNYSHLNYREVITEVTFTYKGKQYTEKNSQVYDQNRLNIFFCNVNPSNFNAQGKIIKSPLSSDQKTLELTLGNLFKDLGGCQSNVSAKIENKKVVTSQIKDKDGNTILGPYSYHHQNFYNFGVYDSNSKKIIKRRIVCTYNDETLLIKKTGTNEESSSIEEDVLDFTKISAETTILFGELEDERWEEDTYILSRTNGEKILGTITVKVYYILLEGAYYSSISSERDPIGLDEPAYTLVIDTGKPTIYKRPFSVGINQKPGDEEILRIDLTTDSSKKYVALGDMLLIDLSTGDFYKYNGFVTTKPTSGVYLVATIPSNDTTINNNIPYREKDGIPSGHKIIYKKYTKKTSF